jgi:hypothetical protein
MKFASLLRYTWPLCFAAALAAHPRTAAAGDKALAETLFQEGRKLLEAGKFDEACHKLEASQRQDPSPGTLLNLGKCNEGRGKTATAWANYKEAESLARNMNRSEQGDLASQRASEIEPKLSRLEVDAPPTVVDGLVVKRGGVSMSIDSLGVAAPVDPGDYDVEASAPGYGTWKGKVTVAAGGNAKIAIPELHKSAEPPPAASAPEPAAQAPAAPESHGDVRADTGTSGGSTKTVGYVLSGVGVVGVLVGGYFGLAAKRQSSDAEKDATLCPNKVCTAAGRKEIDSAKTKALISTIGIGAGVAALGVGIVLIVTSPSDKSASNARAKRHARLTPFVDRDNAGLFVTGAF